MSKLLDNADDSYDIHTCSVMYMYMYMLTCAGLAMSLLPLVQCSACRPSRYMGQASHSSPSTEPHPFMRQLPVEMQVGVVTTAITNTEHASTCVCLTYVYMQMPWSLL